MTLELFLVLLAVVLFGGMFLGLFLSYREIEATRSKAPAPAESPRPQPFYGWSPRDAAMAEELILRRIEHHLRREALIAEQLVSDPNLESLRVCEHAALGAD